MITRLAAVVSLLCLAALVMLPLVGRWERADWLRRQNAGIAAVKHAVGGGFNQPYAYRTNLTFACLLYQTKVHPFGRELCFNASGYIVEAIHRIPNRNPEIWTVRPEPGAARVHVNPLIVAHLLDKLHAQRGNLILTGKPDLGPQQ